MNLLILLRTDILDLIILAFLMLYSLYCSKYHENAGRYFLNMALSAAGHAFFGLITEVTVNSETVSAPLNDVCHVMYFSCGIMFSISFFNYVLSLLLPKQIVRKCTIVTQAMGIMTTILMLFSPTDYLQGRGTRYSSGVAAMVGYGLATIIFGITVLIMILFAKRIQKSILLCLMPISVLGIGLVGLQIKVPELLFTESVMTLITIGCFFAIENPVGKFQTRAIIDLDTGTYNRNSYDIDLKKISLEEEKHSSAIGFVMCDVNNLKHANDTYGHVEGDRMLHETANALTASLKSAYRIYRIGGDEFVAIYKETAIEKIESEIVAAKEAYVRAGVNLKEPLVVAMGVAMKAEGESMEELVNRADTLMYEEKKRLKRRATDL